MSTTKQLRLSFAGCEQNIKLVCGSDGITYDNDCVLDMANAFHIFDNELFDSIDYGDVQPIYKVNNLIIHFI